MNTIIKIGSTLRVGYFVTTDPFNKRGEIGTVIEIDDDIITLRFEDNSIGKYEDDCLNPVD